MKRRKQRLRAHCPRCGEDDEHLLHVLICSADAAVDFRQPLLTDLENWLIDEETHPDIADYLLTGLTSWFEDPFGIESVILSTIPSIRRISTIAGNRLARISLRFYSGTIGYLPTNIQLFHSISTAWRTMGNTPYSSVLENLTPHLDAQECSAT